MTMSDYFYYLQMAPVWEVTGAEFTSSNAHTAGGISIRFPRVTRIRDDKDWSNATDLDRLKVFLFSCQSVRVRYMQGFIQRGGSHWDFPLPAKVPPPRILKS